MKVSLPLSVFLIAMFVVVAQPVQAACSKKSEVCVEGRETRIINGVSVTRDCWRYRSTYECMPDDYTSEPYCQTLADRGCTPIDQECSENSCEVTYQCPTGEPHTGEQMNCEGQTFSLDGGSYDTGYPPNADFGLVASNVTAMEDASNYIDVSGANCVEEPAGSGRYSCTGAVTIFEGKDLRCKKKAASFSNCCKGDGWGNDLGLDSCNAEEKELGYAREGGLCHYIGTYCSEKILGACVAKKQTFCCFTSKLGRIIHEQGRPQLDIEWGTAKNPNCDGFSQEQLQAIDFSLIDFSEFYADAMERITGGPGSGDMGEIIQQYINATVSSGCSQFDPNCGD